MNGKAEFNRALGRRIREARETANIRQDQLALAVGLTRTSITNIERGRQGIQVYLLVRISEVLGCPSTDLLPDQASHSPISLPDKLKDLEQNEREWAERILTSPHEDNEHET